MFNSLSLVVLITSSLEEVNVALEPLKHLYIPLSRSVKQGVFPIDVLNQQAVLLVLLVYAQYFQVFALCSYVYRCLPIVILLETKSGSSVEDELHDLSVFLDAGDVHDAVAVLDVLLV